MQDATEVAGEAGTMRAVVQDRYGSADAMRVERIQRPSPGPGEVLVRVNAAGVDRGTWHLMTGLPHVVRLGYGLRGPKVRVPGLDLAGIVAAVGPGVTRFAEGDRVFGIGRGSFAEYSAAQEDKLAPMPSGLTFEQAAVVPVSGLTAIQALRDAGRVRSGQRVLVNGASGGVGTYAVQLAKAFGAEATGVCSTAKVDLVRALGADHVLDHTREDLARAGRRFDLILDIGGNASIRRLRRALVPRGTLVVVGAEGGRWIGGLDRYLRALILSPFVRQRLTMLISKEHHTDLERLTELIEAGAVTPCIDSTFPLDRVPDALRHLESGRVRGKIAISI